MCVIRDNDRFVLDDSLEDATDVMAITRTAVRALSAVAVVIRCVCVCRSCRVCSDVLTLLSNVAAQSWREWTWSDSDGPGPRRGHSLCFYKSQLIVFGGRTEDTTKTHVPKTYEIHKLNGTLEFLSYEDKVARPGENTDVRVAVHLNDVWSYDISA